MKLLTLLSIVLVGVSGFVFKVPSLPGTPKIANADWILRQKLVLSLFENVCDISTDPAVIQMAQNFASDTTTGNFEDPNAIIRFKALVSGKGLLPKGDIFTEYDTNHIEELQALSEVLITAQDFHTFITAAAWARQNVNCGLFVDAIYLALMKRKDTEKLSVPAPYELLPNYFINKDAIITAASLFSNAPLELGENVRNDGNSYIINANYTSDIYENVDETKLAYFHEDVGLNTYYLLKKLSTLSLMKNGKVIDRYGEYIYNIMKLLATRYDLERYANGLEEVQGISWNSVDSVIYDPMLMYSNGEDFGKRTRNTNAKILQDIAYLENIENSVSTAVNHMVQSGSDKNQILNNLMEILVTGDKSYKDVAHQILGADIDDIKKSPTVFDHYMTSLRDPMFWKLNKKIVNIIDNALTLIPTYSRNEIYFPGVKVMNVDVKKISTSFDIFEIDITDALKPLDSDSAFQIKIAQPRLNHKSFTIKVNITSLVAQKGLMKIFVGPKMLPGELALNKEKFMLLDTCEIGLKKGGNIITRTSEEIAHLSPDFLSLKTLHQNVEDAEFGIGNLPLENILKVTSFPSRLIVPKGTDEGLPLQIFVFIAPFAKVNIATSVAEFNSAILSPRYPLDLLISDQQLFDLPNVLVKEIIVTHKGSSSGKYEGGKGKNWDVEGYDYTARKGQYEQKTNNVEKYFKQETTAHYADIEKITDFPIINQEPRLLQMKPFKIYKSKKTEKLPSYDEEKEYTLPKEPRKLLEKKPFFDKEVTKSKIDKDNISNISVGKNKDIELEGPLENKSLFKDTTKNIGVNRETTLTTESTDINNVFNVNIDKNKVINPVPYSIAGSKNFDINVDKNKAFTQAPYALDGSKNFNINIDKNKAIDQVPYFKDGSKNFNINIDKNKGIDQAPYTIDGSKNFNINIDKNKGIDQAPNTIDGSKNFNINIDKFKGMDQAPYTMDGSKNFNINIDKFKGMDQAPYTMDGSKNFNINIDKFKGMDQAPYTMDGGKNFNINIDKKKGIDQVPYSIDGSKNFNFNIEKNKDIKPIPKSIDSWDGNKVFNMNIDKSKDLFRTITEKMDIDDESVISHEKIHDNIEDIIVKYFNSKLKQDQVTTKRIPTVYDYIVHGFDDYDIDQPKVYE